MSKNEKIADRLDSLVEMGWKITDDTEYAEWLNRVLAFVDSIADAEVLKKVRGLGGQDAEYSWPEYRARQASHLEGLALKIRYLETKNEPPKQEAAKKLSQAIGVSDKVFVVHGHDTSAKEAVARFLEKIELTPVILHEQANQGHTIIEKFELHSNVGFAVVLLTPDDIGASAAKPASMQGRARQNVILELGYFVGKLGRRRVCALYKPGVEIPSDFQGVLFIELDSQDGWKMKLAQELMSAGLEFHLTGLLQQNT